MAGTWHKPGAWPTAVTRQTMHACRRQRQAHELELKELRQAADQARWPALARLPMQHIRMAWGRYNMHHALRTNVVADRWSNRSGMPLDRCFIGFRDASVMPVQHDCMCRFGMNDVYRRWRRRKRRLYRRSVR